MPRAASGILVSCRGSWAPLRIGVVARALHRLPLTQASRRLGADDSPVAAWVSTGPVGIDLANRDYAWSDAARCAVLDRGKHAKFIISGTCRGVEAHGRGDPRGIAQVARSAPQAGTRISGFTFITDDKSTASTFRRTRRSSRSTAGWWVCGRSRRSGAPAVDPANFNGGIVTGVVSAYDRVVESHARADSPVRIG